VRRVRSGRFLISIAIFTTIVGAAVAPIAASAMKSSIHDGFYASHEGTKSADVELFVGGNGTRVLGGLKKSATSCLASPTLVAQDPSELTPNSLIIIKFPANMTIAPSGAFSYAGDVTLSAALERTTMSFPNLPITLKGRFTKGKVVALKTVAVTGTFSAPEICAATTLTKFVDVWDPAN
jgi:hypothetical protein